MTLRDRGSVRPPGPIGSYPAGTASNLPPGPLGFRSILVAAPGATAAVTKKMKMPAPASGNESRNAHEVTGKLFDKVPDMFDVQQGLLANCPLASILAALASTASGRKHITSMVVEGSAIVITDLADVADKLVQPPANNVIHTNRYFVVKVAGKSVEVSDVFYTTDHDQGYEPIYMRSPKGVLWPLVIEKAFAVVMGSYEDVDALTANATWTMVLGAPPKVLAIDAKTDLQRIRKAAADAATVPTIGASRAEGTKHVTSFHGFAMLGIRKSTLELYDPAKSQIIKISDKDFRADFQAILN